MSGHFEKLHTGDVVTCAETGKRFTIESRGFSFNYAKDGNGNVYSLEGVDIRDLRALQDRTKPFYGYISSDGQSLTNWHGTKLGTVVEKSAVRLTRTSVLHGKFVHHYTVRDVHGGLWHGRGNPGLCITLRAYKGSR